MLIRLFKLPLMICLGLSTIVLPNATHCEVPLPPVFQAQSVSPDSEYSHDFERIAKFGDSGNLSDLEQLADKLLKKWVVKDEQHYLDLDCEICTLLSSRNFHSDKQFTLAQNYALSALAKTSQMPVNTQACLVMYGLEHVMADGKPGTQNWADKRAVKTEEWLKTWQRIEEDIDPSFNPHTVVELNVPPPPNLHQGFFSGMNPSNIKDPKARAQYKAAIEKNNKQIEYVTEQRTIRKLERMFSHVAADHLVEAYSQPPYKLDELKRSLDVYIKDVATKQKILDRVATNTATVPQK